MGAGLRNAAAAVGVLGALAALVVVPALVGLSLPDEGPLPPGPRLDVGYGVTLRPPPGARLGLAESRPGAGGVELRAGSFTARFTAVEAGDVDPAAFAAHARRKLDRDEGFRPGPPEPVSTEAGVTGERGPLASTRDGDLSGCYAIFVERDAGVVAVITPVADCDAVPPDLWSAVHSLTFEPIGNW